MREGEGDLGEAKTEKRGNVREKIRGENIDGKW